MAQALLPNPEHPPLGKLLIGLGMTLFGDNPFGWRIMSALFGVLTLVSGVMATRWLFLRRPAAIMAGLLMIFSQTLYIQARIAMLDIFMAGFLMLAFWLLAGAARTAFADRWRFPFAGACLGLSVACKWTAIPLILAGMPVLFLLLWRQQKQSVKIDQSDATVPRALPMHEIAGWLGPFALLVYLATFLPYLYLTHDALSLGRSSPGSSRCSSGKATPWGRTPIRACGGNGCSTCARSGISTSRWQASSAGCCSSAIR